MKKTILLNTFGILFTQSLLAEEIKKPNFVFFMADDLSYSTLQLYNETGKGARTPFLEEMAKEGVIFENAYCNAPVSSAARSTLITGSYAPRLGASSHRKLQATALPADTYMFPSYLKEAGYHTSNASKTDYNNILDKSAWTSIRGKMGDWRKRADKEMPFFHCFTIASCHESCLHFSEQQVGKKPTIHSPEEVNVHPFHPDTELFRYTYARLYDKISQVDTVLGKLIAMLKQDDLLDNTFIFYMGDNGGSLPFSKGYTNEQGLHVPLVVYIPENWKDKVSLKRGERSEGFVSFMDLGSTLLNLAGLEQPQHIDGKAFMGDDIQSKEVEQRDMVYGYGDRYDELYALTRTLRKGNFKYSRNFYPHHPKSLHAFYRYRQAAFREWKELYEAGKLNQAQSLFFQPQGAEELYDLSTDPFEVNNLAHDPKHKARLIKLRKLVQENMLKKRDLAYIPESIWAADHHQDIAGFMEQNKENLVEYAKIADYQLLAYPEARKEIVTALQSTDPIKRYWAITACCSFGETAKDLKQEILPLLNDKSSIVKSRAAVFMAQHQFQNPLPLFKEALKAVRNGVETLMILNDATYVKESHLDYPITFSKEDISKEVFGVSQRLEYLK